jgi:hypothetical protein
LAINSEPDTIARNSGALYGLVQGMCGLVGNTFTYFQFRDGYQIDPDDQTVFIAVLLAISALGVAVFVLILPMPWANEGECAKNTSPAVPLPPRMGKIEVIKYEDSTRKYAF